MPLTLPLAERKLYKAKDGLVLENGAVLQDLSIAYHTHGTLNNDKSNVVWVFHALTANSDPVEWWVGLVGSECLIDPSKYFIVCANMIGSCYGSTEPTDFEFPLVTIRDMVNAHKQLFQHLQLTSIHIGIGGSMGGQQLLDWAVQEPSIFDHVIPIATNARHSPWGIAFNEAQRMALDQDNLKNGMKAARAIALLSYRNHETYAKTQSDDDHRSDAFSASSYQQYQGEKFVNRFSPLSYYYLSKAMDSHNVGRHFESTAKALARIQSSTLVIGIGQDILFPSVEQQFIYDNIPNARFESIDSMYGHDGFLIETEKLATIIQRYLE